MIVVPIQIPMIDRAHCLAFFHSNVEGLAYINVEIHKMQFDQIKARGMAPVPLLDK